MRGGLRRDSLLASILVVAIGILAVRLAARHPAAIDLTRDQRHTLAPATRAVLARLDGPVDVHAYLPTHVQAPYGAVIRQILDLLEAYRAALGDRLRLQVFDPTDPGLSAEEQRTLAEAARGDGVQAATLEVTVADRRVRQQVLFGVALLARDKVAVVPPVDRPELIEYELTRALLELSRDRQPVIGFSQGHGEPDVMGSPLATLLGSAGTIRNVRVAEAPLPSDLDALVILAPTRPFSDRERYLVDQHLMLGKALVALLDYRQQSTLFTDLVVPVSSGLEPLLTAYGATVDPTRTVIDRADNFAAPVHQQATGQVVRANHPAFPIARQLAPGHIITRGLDQVVTPYASPITLAPSADIEAVAMVTVSGPARAQVRSLDPSTLADPTPDERPGPHVVAATLEGPLRSAFAGAPAPPRADGGADRPRIDAAQGSARVFVATAGARMLATQENGLLLLQNALDWALAETDLVALRARRAEIPRLTPTGPGVRAWIKYGNVFGPPLLVLLLGWLRWRRA